jgi:tetratricopeptide (TPR) repeat protein
VRALLLLLALLAPAAQAAPRERAAPRPAPAPPAAASSELRGPETRGKAIAHYLAARRCQDERDWACAAAELQQAVDFDPDNAELRLALAEARAVVGDAEAAEEEARRAIDLAGGTGRWASGAHVLLAQLVRGRDRQAAALELRRAIRLEAEAAVDGEPPDPEPWSLLATLYLEVGDEAAALRTLDDLAARAPGEGGAAREVGRWLLEHGQPGRAEPHLRRAVAAARGDVPAWRLLAHAHAALGRSLDVNDDLRAILDADPGDPEALLGLGRAALEEGAPERARELLDRYQRGAVDRAGAGALVSAEWLAAGYAEEALAAAREARSGLPDARLRLAEGRALAALRRWPEVVQAVERVREQDGEGWVPARVLLAGALSRLGKHAEAARALEAPLAVWPGDVQLLEAQAAALEWAGRAARAADGLARATEERRRMGEEAEAEALRAAQAGVLCRAGRAREAVAALRPAVDARPRSPGLRLALAEALAEAGEGERAEAELRALLALAPDDPRALARLASWLAARGGVALAAARGAPPLQAGPDAAQEAESLARRAVALAPRSPEARAALGRVLSARGDHAGAIAALERAVALSGRSACALEALGDVYLAAGRREEAAGAWRAALAAAGEELPVLAEKRRAGLRRKLHAATVGARE